MGHKKGRKRKHRTEQAADEQDQPEGCSEQGSADPARALVAVHPSGDFLAVSCGSKITVICTRSRKAVEIPEDRTLPIRAVSFSACGRFLATAGDDKLVHVVKCRDWITATRVVAAKKVSAAGFTADGQHILFADKFGDVLVAEIPRDTAESSPQPDSSTGICSTTKPSLLLGHFSSIVTSLTASADNRWLASTDREGKVRVSVIPAQPLKGAPRIQSFCLGHTAFALCAAFLPASTGKQHLLATGSGDGTIRLWDAQSGLLLDVFDATPHINGGWQADEDEADPAKETPASGRDASQDAREEAGMLEGKEAAASTPSADDYEDTADGMDVGMEEGEPWLFRKRFENLPPAVLCIAVNEKRSLLAAAIEGGDTIFLLHLEDGKLALKGKLALPGVRLPNSLAFDSQGVLWGAGGCEGLLPLTLGALSAGEISNGLQMQWKEKVTVQEAKSAVPSDLCTKEMRAQVGAATEAPQSPLAAVKESMRRQGFQVSLELRKWVYSQEEIARRKRNRADLRESLLE